MCERYISENSLSKKKIWYFTSFFDKHAKSSGLVKCACCWFGLGICEREGCCAGGAFSQSERRKHGGRRQGSGWCLVAALEARFQPRFLLARLWCSQDTGLYQRTLQSPAFINIQKLASAKIMYTACLFIPQQQDYSNKKIVQ